ncbi:hypothetical protein [Cerasicoccus maritimus]|uniref:hypothetical protein n=1 Tax=Cerasicoccus maritimus TaxID=490089 RepID=UPI00285297CE|nr:hypothetical protein [Cerasicoccus maritimus]
MLLLRKALTLPAILLCALSGTSASTIEISRAGSEVTVTLENTSEFYYGVEFSEYLGDFETIDMALGSPAPSFTYDRTGVDANWFFRGQPISMFAPQDADGDGLDDVYELQRPYLDPLDPADALEESPIFAGLTNLEAFLLLYGLDDNAPQVYSREVSLFNFGASIGGEYATISREVSLFNFGDSFANYYSREVSIFNGEQPAIAGYPQSYSREVSVYNFGAAAYSIETLSREVSVYNGEQPAIVGYPQSYSREVSVYNMGAPIYSIEAVSREVSIYNDIPES